MYNQHVLQKYYLYCKKQNYIDDCNANVFLNNFFSSATQTWRFAI